MRDATGEASAGVAVPPEQHALQGAGILEALGDLEVYQLIVRQPDRLVEVWVRAAHGQAGQTP